MRRSSLDLVVLLTLAWTPMEIASAGMVIDNFDDGNAYGWVFPFNPNTSQFPGSWNVENGTLVQHLTSDGNAALLDAVEVSNQVIATEVKTLGYAGVVLWHQTDSWVAVVANPFWTGIVINEFLNGQNILTPYNYRTSALTWYDLKVDADSATGELAVYLDGTYLFTHTTSVPRLGQSGVISGNEVGYFDNVRLSSDNIVPEPGSLILWGMIGFVGVLGGVATWPVPRVRTVINGA